jgi:tetratricopeptide (TPR) repeat protein
MQRDTGSYNSSEKKITELQSMIRGSQIRERYQINQLENNELENYPTFVVGNDPEMPKELESFAEPNDKIALVATSGMRAVSLACMLGNPQQLPKIILIDNSLHVTAFWQAMRRFMQYDSKTSSEQDFIQNLPLFLQDHDLLYRKLSPDVYEKDCTDEIKYLPQDIKGFFQGLISKHGYSYIKAVILHASVIKQSWSDLDTFIKIKNIASYLGINKIFTYPSNIIGSSQDAEKKNQILNNIASISPILSIHTDACLLHRQPEQVLLITNQDPSVVWSKLLPSSCDRGILDSLFHHLDLLSKYMQARLYLHATSSAKTSLSFYEQLKNKEKAKLIFEKMILIFCKLLNQIYRAILLENENPKGILELLHEEAKDLMKYQDQLTAIPLQTLKLSIKNLTPTPSIYYEKGNNLFNNGDFIQAITVYKHALATYHSPQFVDKHSFKILHLHFSLLIACMQAKLYLEAINTAETALSCYDSSASKEQDKSLLDKIVINFCKALNLYHHQKLLLNENKTAKASLRLLLLEKSNCLIKYEDQVSVMSSQTLKLIIKKLRSESITDNSFYIYNSLFVNKKTSSIKEKIMLEDDKKRFLVI